MQHYNICTPTTSYFQHNRFTKAQHILKRLKQEHADVALISDAGTPGILDPGYHLINLAIQNNIPITVIPGPTALIMAIVLSGKPAHKFIFEGFLPNKSAARRRRLEALKESDYTVLFYESCHRILVALEDVQDIFGDIPIVVARELTKKFEEVLRDRVSQVRERLSNRKPRGEFVVII